MKLPINAKISILKLLEKDNDVKKIVNLGYNVEQMTQILDLLKDENLIDEDNDNISLTEKARKELDSINFKKSNNWIQIEKRSKIPEIDKNSIYLPNKDELFFD
jgi:predicted methyltransferase